MVAPEIILECVAMKRGQCNRKSRVLVLRKDALFLLSDGGRTLKRHVPLSLIRRVEIRKVRRPGEETGGDEEVLIYIRKEHGIILVDFQDGLSSSAASSPKKGPSSPQNDKVVGGDNPNSSVKISAKFINALSELANKLKLSCEFATFDTKSSPLEKDQLVKKKENYLSIKQKFDIRKRNNKASFVDGGGAISLEQWDAIVPTVPPSIATEKMSPKLQPLFAGCHVVMLGQVVVKECEAIERSSWDKGTFPLAFTLHQFMLCSDSMTKLAMSCSVCCIERIILGTQTRSITLQLVENSVPTLVFAFPHSPGQQKNVTDDVSTIGTALSQLASIHGHRIAVIKDNTPASPTASSPERASSARQLGGREGSPVAAGPAPSSPSPLKNTPQTEQRQQQHQQQQQQQQQSTQPASTAPSAQSQKTVTSPQQQQQQQPTSSQAQQQQQQQQPTSSQAQQQQQQQQSPASERGPETLQYSPSPTRPQPQPTAAAPASNANTNNNKAPLLSDVEEQKIRSLVPDYKNPMGPLVQKFNIPKTLLARRVYRLTSKGAWEPRVIVLTSLGLVLICDESGNVRRGVEFNIITELLVTSHWEGTALRIGVAQEHDVIIKLHQDCPAPLSISQIAKVIEHFVPRLHLTTRTSTSEGKLKNALRDSKLKRPKDFRTPAAQYHEYKHIFKKSGGNAAPQSPMSESDGDRAASPTSANSTSAAGQQQQEEAAVAAQNRDLAAAGETGGAAPETTGSSEQPLSQGDNTAQTTDNNSNNNNNTTAPPVAVDPSEVKIRGLVPDYKNPIGPDLQQYATKETVLARQVHRFTGRAEWEARQLVITTGNLILLCDAQGDVSRCVEARKIAELIVISHWEASALRLRVNGERDVFVTQDPNNNALTVTQIAAVISFRNPGLQIAKRSSAANPDISLRDVLLDIKEKAKKAAAAEEKPKTPRSTTDASSPTTGSRGLPEGSTKSGTSSREAPTFSSHDNETTPSATEARAKGDLGISAADEKMLVREVPDYRKPMGATCKKFETPRTLLCREISRLNSKRAWEDRVLLLLPDKLFIYDQDKNIMRIIEYNIIERLVMTRHMEGTTLTIEVNSGYNLLFMLRCDAFPELELDQIVMVMTTYAPYLKTNLRRDTSKSPEKLRNIFDVQPLSDPANTDERTYRLQKAEREELDAPGLPPTNEVKDYPKMATQQQQQQQQREVHFDEEEGEDMQPVAVAKAPQQQKESKSAEEKQPVTTSTSAGSSSSAPSTNLTNGTTYSSSSSMPLKSSSAVTTTEKYQQSAASVTPSATSRPKTTAASSLSPEMKLSLPIAFRSTETEREPFYLFRCKRGSTSFAFQARKELLEVLQTCRPPKPSSSNVSLEDSASATSSPSPNAPVSTSSTMSIMVLCSSLRYFATFSMASLTRALKEGANSGYLLGNGVSLRTPDYEYADIPVRDVLSHMCK